MNFLQFLNRLEKFPCFSTTEIEKYFPGFDSRRLVEWQQKGYIRKLRNKYYYFSNQPVNEYFLFFSANKLYTPSYVSLETALAHYGFIPEGVFQITSCSTRKTIHFDTAAGYYSYRQIKTEMFFGYRMECWSDFYIKIAEPEKAIIDFLYLNPAIRESRDFNALRWNLPVIAEHISINKMNLYNKHIGSDALNRRLQLLIHSLYALTE